MAWFILPATRPPNFRSSLNVICSPARNLQTSTISGPNRSSKRSRHQNGRIPRHHECSRSTQPAISGPFPSKKSFNFIQFKINGRSRNKQCDWKYKNRAWSPRSKPHFKLINRILNFFTNRCFVLSKNGLQCVWQCAYGFKLTNNR